MTSSLLLHIAFTAARYATERSPNRVDEEVNHMAKKEILDKLSIYVPQKKMEERPVERLLRLSEKRDRSVNYLVVDAILEYLKKEETRN
jgi:hypothetical protein